MTLLRNVPGGAPTPVAVRVMVSPLVEAIIAFWVLVNDDTVEYVEIDLIRELGSMVVDLDDARWLTVHQGHLWLALLALIDQSGAVSFARLADHIEALSPGELGSFVEHDCDDECDDRDGALAAVLDDLAGFQARLVATLRAVDGRVADRLSELEPVLNHGAELERFLARRMPLDQLVDTVTNGVAYEPEAGVREVVLVPSVVMRPWTFLSLYDTSRYIVHPISEESLAADGDTPPRWMIDLFKALGDEKRLRVLRRLGEVGGATLGELTEYLDIAKSTAHHHLRTLRVAGLVRTRITGGTGKDEQVYELRRDLLPDAVALVGEYLLGTRPSDDQETPA